MDPEVEKAIIALEKARKEETHARLAYENALFKRQAAQNSLQKIRRQMIKSIKSDMDKNPWPQSSSRFP